MCIYIDVLIITNAYITWFMLKATSKLTHSKITVKRLAFTSVLGGLFSLIIIFQPNSLTYKLVVLIAKLALLILLNLIAFKIRNLKKLVKIVLISFAVNLILYSCTYLFISLTETRIIHLSNYTVYLDVSVLILAVATMISYALLCLSSALLQRKLNMQRTFTVELETVNSSYILKAISDTGNNVTDIFSGRPVIICTNDMLFKEIDLNKEKMKGYRILPYSTVSSKGIIQAFIPEKLKIKDENGNEYTPDVLVGVLSDENTISRAVFNPAILF